MGLLIIDHSQGQGLDGKQGKKQEYETQACKHCGHVIALLKRGNDVIPLANIDIACATPVAHVLPGEYVHKYRCRRCDANICRNCAKAMEANGGECPGPLESVVEQFRRTGTVKLHDYNKRTKT